MATSEKILIHQKGTSRLKFNHDPNETPYNSFSSFKNIDNTVVSAYEVGAINRVGGKSIHSSKTEEQLVSREQRSLAHKPPSGVKHDHKLLGTSSKSKSLTDIHIIHNKGNKIPDVNVKRFDNRLLRHNVKHSEEIVPTLQTSEVDPLSGCSEDSEKKGEISVITCKEIENKDVRQASSLSSSDKLFESANSETKLDRTSSAVCNTSTKHSKLHSDYSSVNENDKVLQKTVSLDNGIELQKSSLVRVDSGNIHRSRLNHEGSRRHSHRKHLDVRKSSKTENVETIVVESVCSGILTVETDISQPGINSIASRRKLPKVPARLKQTVARMSDMEDSKQENSKPEKKGSLSKLGGDTDTDINIAGIQGKPLLARSENIAFNYMIESDSGKLDTSSGSIDCTSQDVIEARRVNMHKSKLSDVNYGSDENSSSLLSGSLPSQKQKLVDQGFDKKYENLTKVKSELKSNRKGKILGKKSESSNLEDKFRQKLKEIVSSNSNNPVNLSNYDDSIVSIKPDNGHIECFQPVLDTLSDSAKVLKEQTSPVLHSAKGESKSKKSKGGILENAVCLDGDIPASSIFNFNQEVIQELTDMVMLKPEPVGGQCQTPDISETQDSISEPKDSLASNISDVGVSTEAEDKSYDSSQHQFTDRTKDLIEVGNDSDLNQSLKLNIEGKSFNGKSEISNDCDSEGGAKKEMIHPAGEEIKTIQEKVQKDFTQKQGHVLRTPSYRKRVIARAKLRYSKKSQNFKECSCSRKENGELEQCLFCQKFELKKRSQTSLGHQALGDYSDSECSEIASPRRALTPELVGRSSGQGHKSPRSLRKVNVSPRVDVLLSSNLFKKHLQKHENLIQKHTMSYKRFGMNKSVSNLDLSEGFTADTDSSYQDNASEVSEAASERDFVDAASNKSTDIWVSSELSATNRRHSLTGETEIQFSDYSYKTMMRKRSGDTLPSSFTKPRSRPGIGSLFDNVRNRTQSRNYIPSFHEFKKQKELATTDTKNDQDQQSQVEAQKVEATHVSKEVRVLDDNKEKGENDLHTVLETDERGSKENLICAENVENDVKLKPESDKCQPTSSQTVLANVSAPEVLVTHVDSNQNEHLARKAQTRLKGKSRTLPNIDLSIMSDNSSDQSSSHSAREKRRITTKRPRSLISKKLASHDSDTPDTGDKDHVTPTNVSARPKLKGNHSRRIIRSESDSKYETEKGKHSEETVDDRSKGGHSRHLSLLGKGHNSVSFNLDSVKNEGTSDMSSSMTESNLSDSIYSETCVNETITLKQDVDDVVDNLSNDMSAGIKDDLAASVLRSTSDACEITQEAARKRRERKERPYKSDPFSGTEIIPATKRCALREEKARFREHLSFATSSKEEILSFLDGVTQSDLVHGESFPSLEELSEDEQKSIVESHMSDEYMRKLGKHPSNVSSLSTDSGVIGQDESHDSKQSSPSNTLTHSMSEHRPTWHQAQTATRRALSASCSDLSDVKNRVCYDCSNDTIHQNMSFVCPQCVQRRIERKKIIQEVVDTELNYGRDLKILQEEFYKPMLKAGLLTKDQLDCIFLNLDELIHVNAHFITKLKAAINHSNQNEDEDLREVMIGSLFLESSTMFLTFENYCVNQACGPTLKSAIRQPVSKALHLAQPEDEISHLSGLKADNKIRVIQHLIFIIGQAQAPILLEQLEKDKELLRIFLHVSQSDNQLLRRMHLKSFLMVPVQRIMKYPLLLDRLYKVTLDKHRDKEALREAKEKIEDILGHINAKSKSTNVKQRKGSEKHYSVTEKIEVSRVALETLGWNRKDVCDVITTRLHITQPLDHMWAVKKCKNHKFTTVHGVLLSLVQQNFTSKDNEPVTSNTILNTSINNNNNNNHNNNKNNNNFTNAMNNSLQVQSAAVVLIKEKNGRYQVAREPFMLDKCVVSQDPDFMEVFELLEWNRESYLIKAENPSETRTWVHHLRRQMQNLGCWRKRRNALPNILLNHLS